MAKSEKLEFSIDQNIVYPKHGVGNIIDIQVQEISGMSIELYVIRFERERMTLRVPTNKAAGAGMRSISDKETMDKAFETLKGKAKIKRTMWSRRAQEYETKINSGSVIFLAEVVRDLYRSGDQSEQSYSERQIFEAAISRLAREVAAVEEIGEKEALIKLENVLAPEIAA
ncbi:MAG: CarD family transcriptional regulator [Alphaproteobacteria bacterium]|nr:CarD family transcriptional regulator [Alphaproteobacteria bacterium]HPF45704.1 CarD family transcriptional regulator [Emcibacteraceae bacterium]HRW28746.1 CarD family transcriptional regulator [Emcibacteraceae bacterium]